MAALLCLRRYKDPSMAVFLNDADEGVVTEAARAIHDVPILDAMPALAKAITTRQPTWTEEDTAINKVIKSKKGNESFLRRSINANFRLGTAEGVRRLASFAANEGNPESMRLESLSALGDWVTPSSRDRVLGYYRPIKKRDEKIIKRELQIALPAVIARSSGKTEAEATKLAAKYRIAMDDETFLQWVGDSNRPVDTRVEALRLLATRGKTKLTSAVKTALASKAPELRIEARRFLVQLNEETGVKLLSDTIKNGTLREKQAALKVLGGLKNKKAGEIIESGMIRLNKGQLDPSLQLDVLIAADAQGLSFHMAKYQSQQKKSDPLARHRVALKGGRAEKGKDLFKNHQAAQCIRCHKVNGVGGGDTGPDLGKIGATQKREYLLEALVAPNKTIAKGFEMAVLILKDGTSVAGTVVSEKNGQIVIAPPVGPSITVEAAKVKSRSSQKVSSMPPMGDVLKPVELRDLIEFLANQK